MAPISVALECSALCNDKPTGISVYTSSLLTQLEANPELVTVYPFYKDKFFKKRSFYFNSLHPVKPYLHRSLANLANCRITHSTDNKFLYNQKRKNVVTIHDVAIFLKENAIPGYTDEGFKKKMKLLNEEVVRRADLILAVSQRTKDDFCLHFGASPEKVRVVYPGYKPLAGNSGIKEEDLLQRFNLHKKAYFLFVGAISIRKNLLNLLKAYKLSGLYEKWPLVLAGPASMGMDQILQLRKDLKLENQVVLTQFLPDGEINGLYKNAGAFVFPTFYEGFGIPIIEALSHGLPVLTSRTGAATEVSGGLATLVDPFSVEDISKGLHKVVSVKSDTSVLKQYASSFSWEKTAEDTIKAYQSLA